MAVQRDKIIANAEKLVTKGKVEQAIQEYERLLADSPNDVNTLNRIGDLWVRINRTPEAVKVFKEIADRYAKDGFFLKAIAIYKKVNKLDPSQLDVYAQLADLYAKQGLAMEAKGQYQVVADHHLKHGDVANALAAYRKIAELDPNSINIHVKLADLYSQNNQTADALREYDRVGKMLLKRGMLDEARQVFQKALKIDSGNVELAESLVSTLIEAKDFNNAIALLQTTLEANKQNPRLVALLGRTLVAKGDLEGARRVLQQGMSANPTDPSLREGLADLFLRQGNPDNALQVVGPLADSLAAKGDAAAADYLNRIIKIEPLHTPTLAKLVDVYKQLKRESNILVSLSSLAEAYQAVNELDRAARVLEELLQREPQNAQHRSKLDFVRKQLGLDLSSSPAPQPPAPAKPAPMPQPAKPVAPPKVAEPEPPMAEEIPEIEEITVDDLDFPPVEPAAETLVPLEESSIDFEPPPEMDFGFEGGGAGFAAPVAEDALSFEESSAAASQLEQDLDFISEHMTEAEVFAKYGLAEKAIEHLQIVLSRAPENADAIERLLKIYLDEGQKSEAQALAVRCLTVHQNAGNDAAFDRLFNDLLSKGFIVDPGPPVVVEIAPPTPVAKPKPAAPKPVAPPPKPVAPVEVEPEEVELSFDEPAEAAMPSIEEEVPIDFETEAPAELSFEEPAPPEPAVEELSFEEPAAPAEPVIEELSFEEPAAPAESAIEELSFEEPAAPAEPVIEELSFEEPAPPPEPVIEELSFEEPAPPPEPVIEELSFEEPAPPPEPVVEELSFEEPPAQEFAPPEPVEELSFEEPPAAPSTPTSEDLGEVDYYIAEELYDVARAKLNVLLESYPENIDLLERQGRLEEATAPPPVAEMPPALAPTFTNRDIEEELLGAIPEDDEEIEIHAPAATAAAPPKPAAPAIDEGNLFDDEDEWINLASELAEEMQEDQEPISLAEEEQSLEDIFREFKKGVEQQLDSEDYDTHYNLGIAYKEMGLIDEAIGEFQLASKDQKKMIECCSMLGLCFLEKGMPQLAVKWYKKGLESPDITEDENLGLLYDLGSTYMETGDLANAKKAFLEVYGIKSNYREIVAKIKQVDDAR